MNCRATERGLGAKLPYGSTVTATGYTSDGWTHVWYGNIRGFSTKLAWKSSNSSVLEVDGDYGILKAKKAGNATITLTLYYDYSEQKTIARLENAET